MVTSCRRCKNDSCTGRGVGRRIGVFIATNISGMKVPEEVLLLPHDAAFGSEWIGQLQRAAQR